MDEYGKTDQNPEYGYGKTDRNPSYDDKVKYHQSRSGTTRGGRVGNPYPSGIDPKAINASQRQAFDRLARQYQQGILNDAEYRLKLMNLTRQYGISEPIYKTSERPRVPLNKTKFAKLYGPSGRSRVPVARSRFPVGRAAGIGLGGLVAGGAGYLLRQMMNKQQPK